MTRIIGSAIIFFIFFAQPAHAFNKIEAYGAFGIEEKNDVSPGRFENAVYFGAFLNIDKVIEAQGFITSDVTPNKNHFSINYHHRFFDDFQPFVNLGLGSAANQGGSLHINLDLGFQLKVDKILIRVFHKTQNRMWGSTQYAIGAFFFSVGANL